MNNHGLPDPEGLQPVGAIVDTNSSRVRFDLVIYRDGILGVRGTYVGVALRAAGAGMVGAGGAGLSAGAAAGAGSASGALAGRTYEAQRLSKMLRRPRSEILSDDANNHFIPIESIKRLALRKRWYGHSLTIITENDSERRKYTWKPALNRFGHVRDVLEATFPGALAVE